MSLEVFTGHTNSIFLLKKKKEKEKEKIAFLFTFHVFIIALFLGALKHYLLFFLWRSANVN